MTIEFHDPRAEPATPASPYLLSANLDESITIGLLANGFPDSEAFLDEVDRALAQKLPAASIKRYNKHGASVPANDALMDQIASECDVFLSAYGH